MAKRKLQQFAEITTFPNVFHNPQKSKEIPNHPLKGKWRTHYFNNQNPIVVELGCGKGEYTIGLASKNPQLNYIGIDLKGNRLWTGAKQALEQNMKNVAFVRTRIENLTTIFSENEVNEIWITFPDPQPSLKREKKRLTASRYLSIYQKILTDGGLIHVKTDNRPFMEFTIETAQKNSLEILNYTFDLYSNENSFLHKQNPELISIKTYYEKLFTAKGFKINYCCIKMNHQHPIVWDKELNKTSSVFSQTETY